MTKVTFTNTTDNPFVTPNNITIPARGAAQVPDYEKIASHDVMKAWIEGGFLVKGDHVDELIPTPGNAPASTNTGSPANPTDVKVTFVAKTDEEIGSMTNAQLAEYIETTLGGQVKSGSNKDDLIKQAKELQTAKTAN